MATDISPEEVSALQQREEPMVLIDVRTPAEFRSLHATPAINVPLDVLTGGNIASIAAGRPVYIICKSGGRSSQACRMLDGTPGLKVFNVTGGTEAWSRSGLPTVAGAPHISLDRQVRMVAGSLVLIGLFLGRTVHPAFNFLSAFVGAGLLFAGITNTCAMMLVLSKMPWNKA